MKLSTPAMPVLLAALLGCTTVPAHDRPGAPAGTAPVAQQAGGTRQGETQAPSAPPQPPARRTSPRRHVWQDIATMPPAAPPSAYQTLPVPQPSPMPAPPAPSSFPAQCGPLGCAAPDGTRLQGSGGTVLGPGGRPCVQGPVTIQCF